MTTPARRRLGLVVLVVLGVPLGMALRLSLDGAAGTADPPGATAAHDSLEALDEAPLAAPAQPVVLAWIPGGLPVDVVARVAGRPEVVAASEVRGETVPLGERRDAAGAVLPGTPPGWALPVDLAAIDPAGFARFAPADLAGTVADLGDDEVLVSTSAAARWGLSPGWSIALDGRPLVVRAVVDDRVVGGAEAAVSHATGEALGLVVPRYVLVEHRGDRSEVERAIASVVPAPVRFRAPGEVAFLREADAVPTQSEVKDRFGEFAVVDREGRTDTALLEIDPAWLDEHIVTATVPLLGEVRCHRSVVPALEGAMRQLEHEGLGYLVDPASSGTCWSPVRIDGSSRLSRHAWGIAVDLNAAKHPAGVGSVQGGRLVEVMAAWGFLWGGEWREPQPSYFELTGLP